MAKFRKKPVVIEAEQFIAPPDGVVYPLMKVLGVYYDDSSVTKYSIDTLEGKHEVSDGDWIITGIKGEHYPCKPDIFELTYESVDIPIKPVVHISDVKFENLAGNKAVMVGHVLNHPNFDPGTGVRTSRIVEVITRNTHYILKEENASK